MILFQFHDRSSTRHEDVALRALENDVGDELRGRLLGCLAQHNSALGRPVAGDYGRGAVELIGGTPSPWLALAYNAIAQSASMAASSGDPSQIDRMFEALARSLDVCTELGPLWLPTAHGARGNNLMVLLRTDEALEAYVECLRPLMTDATFPVHTGAVQSLSIGRHASGRGLCEEHEHIYRTARDRAVAFGQVVPGDALDHAAAGDYASAHRNVASWLDFVRPTAPEGALRLAALHSGVVAGMGGRWARASRLFGAGLAQGVVLSGAAFALYRHWLPRVRAHLPQDRARALRDEGRAMSLEDALTYAQTWIEPAPTDEIS